MTAVGYIRVSTEDQAKEGLSLEAQADRIRGYCTAKAWELTDIVTDAGLSGKDLNRPGIQQVISLCRDKTVDVVVVVKLDRLTRSLRDKEFLFADVFAHYGVQPVGVDESLAFASPDQELSLNVRAVVNQHERRVIGVRTKAALAFKQQRGEWIGRVPFGFRVEGKHLVEDPQAQTRIAKARQMRRQGKSIPAISSKLSMSIATVWRILNDRNGQRKRKYTNKKTVASFS